MQTRFGDMSFVALSGLRYVWDFYIVFFNVTSRTSLKSVMFLSSWSEDVKTFLRCWGHR